MAEKYRDRLFGFLKSRAVGQRGELFTEASRERPSSAPRHLLPPRPLGKHIIASSAVTHVLLRQMGTHRQCRTDTAQKCQLRISKPKHLKA